MSQEELYYAPVQAKFQDMSKLKDVVEGLGGNNKKELTEATDKAPKSMNEFSGDSGEVQEYQVVKPFSFPDLNISTETLMISGVSVGIFIVVWYVINLSIAVRQALKNGQYLKELCTFNYVSEQLREYAELFSDFTEANNEQERINSRTRIFNFLNRISRQICEVKDRGLATKLGDAFFSKIEGRYIKMSPIPEGLIYFRGLARVLLASGNSLSGEGLVKHVRKKYKNKVKFFDIPKVKKEKKVKTVSDGGEDERKKKRKFFFGKSEKK